MPIQFGYDLLSDIQGVQFRFASAARDQEGWRVENIALKESISSPYTLDVGLSSETLGPDAHAMLGENASLEITHDGETRLIHGIVASVGEGEWSRTATAVRVTVVPALHALEHSSHSRIFEDMTVPEIVQLVCDEALRPYGRKLEPPCLFRQDYPKREYTVQHRESDFAFVSRLLAEEGIWFHFRHPNDGEVEQLFLRDANDDAPPVADDPEVEFSPEREPNAQHPAITVFSANAQLRSTAVRVRHYNWTHPELDISGEERVKQPERIESQRPLARYEHGDLTLFGYKEPRYMHDDAAAQARVRLERHRHGRRLIHGASNVLRLQAGHSMTVNGKQYLIIEANHTGNATLSSGQAGHHGKFENLFVCVPLELEYRPTRQGKGRIDGIQTATVVDRSGNCKAPQSSSEGEDIVTDAHGRIRVKFPWDEAGADTQGTSSCWLRVAQLWAGSGWGAQFVPRVGMEVVVQFLDGDPDRPVVTGCLYNGLNPPPYASAPTQSGIKTASSVDRARYNELRFEDKKDCEQIYVRAQKDYVEQVLNDHSTTVSGAQTNTVKQSQSESVGGDQSLTVAGKRIKTVGGDKENGEEITIKGERRTTVTKDETQIFEQTREVTVTGADTYTCKDHQKQTISKGREVIVSENDDNTSVSSGNKTTKVKAKYTIKSEGQFGVEQGAGGDSKLAMDGAFFVQTKGDVTLTNGKSKLYGGKSGKLALEANEEIKLVCGGASLSLKKDGSVTITGVKVSVGTSANSVKFDPAGVKLSGVKVSSSASAMYEVTGPLIKIG